MRITHAGRLRRRVLAMSMGGLAALASLGVFVAAALAWPNTTSGQVTGQPVCNTATGKFEGNFVVVWTVTQVVDGGWTLTSTKPSTPHEEQYSADEAGETVGFSFELTQEKGNRKQTKDFSGSVTLPNLGQCQEEHETHKVTICHFPPGNPGNAHEIEVDESALPEHYAHGDYLGQCEETPPPPPVDYCDTLPGTQAEDEDCPPVEEEHLAVTAGVTFIEATCEHPNHVVADVDNKDGIDYSVEGDAVPGGTVTVTATALDGYVIVGQKVWKHTFAAAPTDCGTPPPPPPTTVKSDEFMDVQVIKDATPQVQLVNGQADIAYSVRVRNNGPNQAHNVVLTDAAPGGVTFLAVTLQPVGGTCTVTTVLLSCTLGTLGPGVERTIGLSARVTQTGTYVNSATGIGDGKDTNGANNTDDASTLVTAPVTPPTTTPKPPVTPKPKRKPKPKPDICRILKVTPGMMKATGKTQIVLAKVTRSRNPVSGVAVRFSGKGIAKVVRTNKQGVARLALRPSKAGIMLVKITSAKACNSARIGVVGVFEPPVTG